jgi:hypothetical protein
MFIIQDYSDNSQGIHTILHAKFRDKDMAKQFSDKVTEIVEILSNK